VEGDLGAFTLLDPPDEQEISAFEGTGSEDGEVTELLCFFLFTLSLLVGFLRVQGDLCRCFVLHLPGLGGIPASERPGFDFSLAHFLDETELVPERRGKGGAEAIPKVWGFPSYTNFFPRMRSFSANMASGLQPWVFLPVLFNPKVSALFLSHET